MLTTPILFLGALAASVFAAPTEKRAAAVIEGVQWKASNFTRPCTATVCSFNFVISVIASGTTTNVPCVFTDSAPANASTHSFSDIPCAAPSSGWHINWGYNPNGDFAVMTVVNTVASQDAFFGYDQVAKATSFKDVGPESVYALGTFS
ncbi:surface SP1 protein [Rutstroemia sp. NJR-2017a WRK4]|nr:surface SP1 protein [Rutstroemia sp. NJR-2017a WRK4]